MQETRPGAWVHAADFRARGPAEFIAKICITVEEADEAQGWLETLIESRTATSEEARRLFQESTELLKVFAASKTDLDTNQANHAKQQQSRNRNR